MLRSLILDGVESFGRTIEVRRPLCTPLRYPRSQCRACVEACPLGALRRERDKWTVASACDACGACAGACPTGALDMAAEAASDIEWKIRRRLGGAIRFACAKVASVPAGAIPVGCAARLDESLLVAGVLGGASEVVVHTGDCGKCERREALERVFPAALRWAKAILKSLGFEDGACRLERGGLPGAPPNSGRRDFFRALARSVAAATELRHERSAPGKGRRARLVEAIRACGRTPAAVDAGGFPLGNVSIRADLCTGCTACNHVCATGALTRREIPGGGVAIRFDAALCTACGACAEACFLKAVRVDPSQTLEPLAAVPEREIVRLVSRACLDCGREILSAGADRCPRCRSATPASG